MGLWLRFPALFEHVWSLSHTPVWETAGRKSLCYKSQCSTLIPRFQQLTMGWSQLTLHLFCCRCSSSCTFSRPSAPLTGQCILTLFLNRCGLKITPKICRCFYFNTWSKPGWHHWAKNLLISRKKKKRQILTKNQGSWLENILWVL